MALLSCLLGRHHSITGVGRVFSVISRSEDRLWVLRTPLTDAFLSVLLLSDDNLACQSIIIGNLSAPKAKFIYSGLMRTTFLLIV